MKFGLENEPAAAHSYAEVTGNNVYLSGFVVNPSCLHLGASPDRKVFDLNSSPVHGLLEIKCSMKELFQDCDCLKKNPNNSTYTLKTTHAYYYQIMGQLGIIGLQWCDLFVMCANDYH